MQDIFSAANILLPRKTDMSKYSVVACDQYTSEIDYWQGVADYVGDSMSTYKMIFPEAYFKTADFDKTISEINSVMRQYFSEGRFAEHRNSMCYVKRKLKNGKIRHGVIGALDLEKYDFSVGSVSPIRATEGTVLDRLPPRVKIRENAPLELPHIMVLIDDREKTVIEPIEERIKNFEKLYSFKLMKESGSIAGYSLDKSEISRVQSALAALCSENSISARYGSSSPSAKLCFAVGDGNHSLATAKKVYEQIKAEFGEEKALTHPARYALVELVNLHDNAIEFEPIHRICFGVNAEALLAAFTKQCGLCDDPSSQAVDIVLDGKVTRKYMSITSKNLSVGTLQDFLDIYLKENGGECDYIHGDDVVKRLSAEKDTIGFLLPNMAKNDLFMTVIKDGALPRKTFSMGHACDKRFYLEARKIK